MAPLKYNHIDCTSTRWHEPIEPTVAANHSYCAMRATVRTNRKNQSKEVIHKIQQKWRLSNIDKIERMRESTLNLSIDNSSCSAKCDGEWVWETSIKYHLVNNRSRCNGKSCSKYDLAIIFVERQNHCGDKRPPTIMYELRRYKWWSDNGYQWSGGSYTCLVSVYKIFGNILHYALCTDHKYFYTWNKLMYGDTYRFCVSKL